MAIKVNGKIVSGNKGEDGKSAYQYAVDGGFTGTEEEFQSLMSQAQNLEGGPFLPIGGGKMLGTIYTQKGIANQPNWSTVHFSQNGYSIANGGASITLNSSKNYSYVLGLSGDHFGGGIKIGCIETPVKNTVPSVRIAGIENPVFDSEASNKKYVDESIKTAISDSWAKAY